MDCRKTSHWIYGKARRMMGETGDMDLRVLHLPKRVAFTPDEFRRRLQCVRDAAAARELDLLVLHSPEDIYYLSGYQSVGFSLAYHALVVPLESDPCLIIRFGERSNASSRSWLEHVETYRDTEDPFETLTQVLQRSGARRVGVEPATRFLTRAVFDRLARAGSPRPFREGSGICEELRAIKSGEELAYVEAAARVSGAAVLAGIEAIDE